MKILVNDIAASTGGALSILKSFYEFAKADKKNEYIFLLSDNYIEETENIKIITMPQNKIWLKRLRFDLFTGKKFINNLKVDAIFSLQNTIIFGAKTKQIVYIHQSIPFQNVKKFSLLKKNERKLAIIQYFIGYIIKKSIKNANYTIVQTEWMKEAVCKKTGINKDNIIVIKPEININSNIKVSDNLNTNTFFYPASNAIYKNHECIYEACKKLNNQGIKDYKLELTLNNTTDIEQVESIGNLSYDEVLDKYSQKVLVFPSYIETVGLPLLEARNVGTIILVSDCLYSKEVLKDYPNAYYFNPFKPEELAKLMQKCINEEIKLIQTKQLEQLQESNWNTILNLI